MVISGSGVKLEELARDLLGFLTHLGLARTRTRRGDAGLSDIEYFTLELLEEHGTLIVGHLQRMLGILPAQMSRIIRSLETRDRPLIACHINADDKRKINVRLTSAGNRAVQEWRNLRAQPLLELLRELPESDQEDLRRLVDRLQGRIRPSDYPGELPHGKAKG